MSDQSTVTPDTVDTNDPVQFAKHFLGVEVTAEQLSGAEPSLQPFPEEAEDAPEVAPDETPDDDAEKPDAEKPAEEEVKLPFTVLGDDGAELPGTSVQKMQLTFKADDKTVTLPLADVVRRAQSEPAAQRQARQFREVAERTAGERDSAFESVESLRSLVFQMVQDQDTYLKVAKQVEEYHSPEGRAARAEQQLAAEREAKVREQQDAEFRAQVTEFFSGDVVPAITGIREQYPMVTEEELLGRFTVDTAKWSVNGVIPPKHHADLAQYLRGAFQKFAAERHAQMVALQDKAEKAERKAQIEAQRRKNESAAPAKPAGGAPPIRTGSGDAKRPATYKEAAKQGLDTLLAGFV